MTIENMFEKIRKTIRAEINAEIYKKGDILPSELELAKRFNVSRMTVRQAVKPLVEQGILEPRRRIGTRVMMDKESMPKDPHIVSMNDQIRNMGFSPERETMTQEIINIRSVDKNIFEAFQTTKDTKELCHLVRLYSGVIPGREKIHLVLQTVYLSASDFPDFMDVDFTKTGIFKYYLNHERRASQALEKIKARLASPEEIKILNLKTPQHQAEGSDLPQDYAALIVYERERCTYDQNGNVLEWLVSIDTHFFSGYNYWIMEGKGL